VWQALREELHPLGVEFVSVALDLRGLESTEKYLRRAHVEHPALLDRAHRLDELLGVVNVPSGTWVDEEGVIVRPPETAFPEGSVNARVDSLAPIPENLDPYLQAALAETRKIRIDATGYTQALRDWAMKGSASRYALSPEEVVERSRPRSMDSSRAASTSMPPARRVRPSRISERPTGSSRTTGPTSARHGAWCGATRDPARCTRGIG